MRINPVFVMLFIAFLSCIGMLEGVLLTQFNPLIGGILICTSPIFGLECLEKYRTDFHFITNKEVNENA